MMMVGCMMHRNKCIQDVLPRQEGEMKTVWVRNNAGLEHREMTGMVAIALRELY